jgi:hypothetical protein
MWHHPKFAYKAPNQTMPNQITLNRIKRSNTKACIIKSCEVCSLLRYYAAYNGNPALTFWDILSFPAWSVKKSKRENIAPGTLTYTSFFFVTLSIVRFLKTHTVFWKQDLFQFSGKEAPYLVDPWLIKVDRIGHALCVKCKQLIVKYVFFSRHLFLGFILDLDKCIFPWQLCFFWLESLAFR